jgi:formate dehydrogenase subunit delta
MSSPEKLVYMANQIGKFFVTQGRATDRDQSKAVAAIAEHIRKFWEPRMRNAIFAHLEAGGVGLDPAVRAAIERLKAEVAPA